MTTPTTEPAQEQALVVTPDDPRIADLVSALAIEDKVLLLTGQDFWSTWPLEQIGLRSIVVSDGPSGVRGERFDERSPSLNLPSATALSSSWDPAVAYRYATLAAVEARRKGVDVVLGPTINLHRSPLGGRHFEAFSEDPRLTADLAAGYVRGLQDHGVGATPKHYVANDSETDRMSVDVVVSDRALRELYLLAFERSVVDAHAWTVMSSYNSINGATASENSLLQTPLNDEWGFDGVVISDWTAVRSLNSARFPQDLVMPGPHGPWGDALTAAVKTGEIDEAIIDRKVVRLLTLAARVGALDGFDLPPQPPQMDGVAFIRVAEAEGTVLVRNNGILPIAPDANIKIAVIGDNALHARTQGGGSATVIPESVVNPLDGLTATFGADNVTYARGAFVRQGIGEFNPATMTNPVTGNAGGRVRFLDAADQELFAEDRLASYLFYLGDDAPLDRLHTFEFETIWTPELSGPVKIGAGSVGEISVFLDDEHVLTEQPKASTDDIAAMLFAPPSVGATVEAVAGRSIKVKVRVVTSASDVLLPALSVVIGTAPGEIDPDKMIADAAAAAAGADIAVVVVGTNAQVESEGFDRTSLALPGRQDDLVAAVAAANPDTVVVVNSGSPVLMPWRNDVAAILLTYFGGQEYGHALGDVLSGAVEPGGRLPTTWPAHTEDVPVLDTTPTDGTLTYDEGIHIGYRAWLRAGTEPAYEFGYGLGYTEWLFGEPSISASTTNALVQLDVTNVGARAGKAVVQLYASKPDSGVDRPVKWLVGFAIVRAEAGLTETTAIEVPYRSLAYWDDGWQMEPGDYLLTVGTSVTDSVGQLTVTLR